MSKFILTNIYEDNRICDVVDSAGLKFDVHSDFTWKQLDSTHSAMNVDDGWLWKDSDEWDSDAGTFFAKTIVWEPSIIDSNFETDGYKFARIIAYKSVGDQLDMLYKEIQSKGSIDSSGDWFQHITQVKTDIPKDSAQAVLDWYANNVPDSST